MSHRPLLFSIAIPTRWADEDRYGHINNVAYFRYFEEARVQWLRELAIPVDGLDTGPVVIEVAATYLKPVHYPATVIVKAFVRKLGNSSVIIDHELVTAEQSDTLFARGHAAIVWVDHRSNKSMPLPDVLRDHLKGFVSPIE